MTKFNFDNEELGKTLRAKSITGRDRTNNEVKNNIFNSTINFKNYSYLLKHQKIEYNKKNLI